RNRGRNRHESHDFLFAAAGQPREEPANRLDAILRISRDSDYRLRNPGRFGGTSRCRHCCFTHEKTLLKVLIDWRELFLDRIPCHNVSVVSRLTVSLGSGLSNHKPKRTCLPANNLLAQEKILFTAKPGELAAVVLLLRCITS